MSSFTRFQKSAEVCNMQKQHKITHFLKNSMVIVIIICIAVFTFLTLYINKQSDNTINEVGSTYMASMNERISKHFSTMIEIGRAHV